VGRVEEVLVEGFNRATGQWIGRTSQHKTLNFTSPETGLDGRYLDARVLRAGPNSLAGEALFAI
jgi:tRNA-2-methylthio-N6-dimethylallyladenosine synthase